MKGMIRVRWRFTVIVCVLLLLTMLPIVAAANGTVIGEPLDFTLDSGDDDYPGTSGDGWAWDEGSKTLTLSGVNIDVGAEEEGFAIKLPDGAEIVLAAGTDNSVSNSCGDAIYGKGSLVITGGGNLTVSADREGIYAGRGNLSISGCGEISVTSENYYGIDIYGDITISGCGEVALASEDGDGIYASGAVLISNCAKLSIQAADDGIYAYGSVMISNCTDVKVELAPGEGNGGDYALTGEGLLGSGISAGETVTVTHSALTVSGGYFGICTGYGNDYPGGDIAINQSYVHACCDENGYAAIFAGDNLPYGEGEHARIVLNGCVITSPSAGLVLDVNIEQESGDLNCQSITDLDGTWIITSWDQAVKDVTIEPLAAYTLTYDANGGSGSVADANSPYSAGATVTVLPSAFTAPAGKTFTGWNTKADGSGTAYAPGATFAIAGNTVLYAQYSAIPVFTVTFDSQGGGAVAALTVHANSTINAPAPPVRSGHTFGGWYKDKECKNAWNFATDRITGNTTLYARWTLTEPTPPSSGQGYAYMGFIIAGCLLGGLFLLIRHRQHA